VTNDWQGRLRFGHLDLDLLAETVRDDLAAATMPVRHGLAVTCLDQVGDLVDFWQHDHAHRLPIDEVVRCASASVAAAFCFTSAGADASCVGCRLSG